MASLTARTSPVIVNPDSQGTTVIDWDSGSPDFRVQIFERRNMSGGWDKRPLTDPAVQGSYPVSFHPGDVYDAMMFSANWDVDPNGPRNEIDPLAVVRVFALLPMPSNLITDGAMPDQQDVGGTYYARKVATGGTPTFATLQLGKTPPVTDAAGFLQIPTPIGIVEDEPTTIHDFQVMPLDPGNLYFSVVRVHDSSGMWQQASYAFTTKRQIVKLQWKDLFINQDGILWGSGSGFFQVFAYEGTSLFADMVNDIWWERITHFKTGNTFDLIPHGEIVQTGPRIVGDDNRKIALRLRGISYRSWPHKNEIATSALGLAQEIHIPVGRDQETVVNREDSLYAAPQDESGLTADFAFTIHVIVNVAYQP